MVTDFALTLRAYIQTHYTDTLAGSPGSAGSRPIHLRYASYEYILKGHQCSSVVDILEIFKGYILIHGAVHEAGAHNM